MNNNLLIIVLSTVYALLSVLGASLIKSKVQGYSLHQATDYFRLVFEWKVMIGLGIIFIASLVLFKALSIGQFSQIIPLSTAINFVCTTLIGWLVFSEKIGVQQIIGTFVILVGIIILSKR